MKVLLHELRPVARKEYRCMAYDIIDDYSEFTHDELKAYARMKRNGGMIQKGERYLRQSCVRDGEVYEWIANIEMHNICIKDDLYDE